ncbi:hypothetical protein BC941DRAFT_475508 [Chlamydoabsidia padenii]|nr:hypothetical protein BC941DRAFT_475508 [Chlamydoabsidia padenii]
MATQPVLWHEPRLVSSAPSILKSLHKTNYLGTRVRKLQFGPSESSDTMVLVISHTPLLVSLTIDGVRGVNNLTMTHLALLCPPLTDLTLNRLPDVTTLNLTSLRHLSLVVCPALDLPHTLTSLSITHCAWSKPILPLNTSVNSPI